MYKKAFQNVFTVFMVVGMLTATIGCDLGQRQAPVSSDAGVLSDSVTGSVKALPINGESISQPLFSTDLSNGYVDIHSVSVDTTNKTVTMTLTHHSGGLQWDRAFAIGFYEEGANQFGFRSILSDQDGALLWEFSYAVDTTDENHWWFSERTLFDEMTMEHRSGLDFTDEIYTINGVSQTFHFNTSDVDELKTLHRDLLGADKKQMQNMLSSSSINDVATILVLKEFDSFYDGDNSLHYNNDGALVVQWCPTTAWPAGLAPSTWVATTNHFSVPAGPIGFVCPLPCAPLLNALC